MANNSNLNYNTNLATTSTNPPTSRIQSLENHRQQVKQMINQIKENRFSFENNLHNYTVILNAYKYIETQISKALELERKN